LPVSFSFYDLPNRRIIFTPLRFSDVLPDYLITNTYTPPPHLTFYYICGIISINLPLKAMMETSKPGKSCQRAWDGVSRASESG
jgi:hypothetical protein